MSNDQTRMPPTWPMGHVPGAGRVPGGPRSRTSNTPSGERVVQIASGSTAIVPKLEEDDISMADIPAVQQHHTPQLSMPEKGEITETQNPEVADFDDNWLLNFQRQMAEFQASRSSSSGSGRQQIYRGPTRYRSEITTVIAERERSRSPERVRPISSEVDVSDSMFFPDRRHSQDPDFGPMRESPDPRLPSISNLSMSGTPPAGSLPHNADDEPQTRCSCPISYNCTHRRSNELDCRPLVWEWMKWPERQDQESFEVHRLTDAHGERRTTTGNLTKIARIIDTFKDAQTSRRRETAVKHMRDWILDMEDVTLEGAEQQQAATTVVVLVLTQFLAPATAQMRRNGRVPTYIEEELTVLERKWRRGDFDGNVKRGLIAIHTRDVNGTPIRTRYEVDKHWPHRVSGLYFGEGNLVNGQIWMSRTELMRDGVHAPPIAGISGSAKTGAYSIVLGEFNDKKNIGYADIDMGDVIEYMGTALKDKDDLGPTNIADEHMHHEDSFNQNPDAAMIPTAATRAMMKSIETGTPVRVIRSCKMAEIVPNKPRKGYRYDGQYRVVGKTAMKEARQIWSFRLERLPGQGRLRGFRSNADMPDSNGRRRGHLFINSRRPWTG